MSRANRCYEPGMISHLTHRCHNGAFLFRSARDRSEYRELLRQAAKYHGVSLLNFSLTRNHAHDLVLESREGGISRMMHDVEGEFAGKYNRRKGRRGAFFSDRYHSTMVEDGVHLWNCVQYIDLNMVRAGVVSHPDEWEWCGFRELMGQRLRYRMLDMDLLLHLLGCPDVETFRAQYRNRIDATIAEKRLKRQKHWTEGIAVGGKNFVSDIAFALRHKRSRPRIEQTEDGSWAFWETPSEYPAG